MTKILRTLVAPDGRILRVPGNRGWTVAARMELAQSELTRAARAPVRFAPSGLPNAGNLKTIDGRPDVLVRVNGGAVDREHRASMHLVRHHHDALVQHMEDGGRAYQIGVAAVGPRHRGRATLALTCYDYAMVAPAISAAFAARGVRRMNLTLAARRDGTGLALRIPELGVPLTHGVEELARILRHECGTDPSAVLTTEERVAVVAAVMERKMGLRTSVAFLDARTKVAHERLHAVGLCDAPPHQVFGRTAPCAYPYIESLARTDLIGAPDTGELFARPDQELVLVEVENQTKDGVTKIDDRITAVATLGLRASECILVVRDEDEEWFRRRLARAKAVVRSLTRVEPMSRWYAEYCAIRDGHIAAQRALVRRAVA